MISGKPLDPKTVEIRLPNQMGYERVAMGSAAAFAKCFGFLPDRIEDLKTAVAEACINAVRHGNKDRPDARVIVIMNFTDGVLHVSVLDEGEGFKEIPKDPDIINIVNNLAPPVGFGVFLMKRLMDEIDFRKLPGTGNEVRMAMKLDKQGGGEKG